MVESKAEKKIKKNLKKVLTNNQEVHIIEVQTTRKQQNKQINKSSLIIEYR